MLQSMREGAKSPVMKFFLIFLAAGFALWGIGDVGTGLFSGGNKAVEAGSRSATSVEIANEFERVRRTAGGGISTGDAIQYGLLDEVIGTTARAVLFEAEADRLGLVTTQNMQKTAIQNEPSFKDALGGFSETAFRRSLAQSGFNEQSYLGRLETVLLQEQILQSVSAATRFPRSLVDAISAYQLEQRSASWIEFPANPDVLADPDEASLAAYYDEVQSSYDAPVMRDASVIYLTPSQIAATLNIDEEAIRQAYQDRLDEFTKTETRLVKQMVFTDETKAQDAVSKLNAGEAFGDVAADLLGWSEADTDLGEVEKNELAAGFNDAVFDASAGAVIGPVQTAFGYHVARVDAISPAEQVEFDDVRQSITESLAEEQAIDEIYDLVARLEDATGSGATLQEAAQQLNITVSTLSAIDANGFDIDGRPFGENDEDTLALVSDSLFLTQLFETEIDDISPVIETAGDSFFVLQPTAETQSRARALSEVRMRLIADWKSEQALKNARAQAEAAQNSTDGLATAAPSPAFTRTGAGLDSDFARLIATAAFDTASGETTLIDTGSGTLLLRTEDIIDATADAVSAQSDQLVSNFNSLTQTDLNTAIGIRLADIHNLNVNGDMVRQLLLGQTASQ